MDPRSILDKGSGQEALAADGFQQDWPGTASPHHAAAGEVRFPPEDGAKSLVEMAQRDLNATLQLLAERAQYITGATGAAIALRSQQEMVCWASAGASAPAVGAQLQVNSGLSGESVRTRQTLRCDDATTDPRVNRESCEALGIASVVVMPLVQQDEVIGVFELFSDKASIFEPRDLTALERMGTMVFTALEHAEAARGVAQRKELAAETTAAPAPEVAAAERHPQDGPTAEVGLVASALLADFDPSRLPGQADRVEIEAADKAEMPVAGESPRANPRSGIAFHMRLPTPVPVPPNISIPGQAPVEVTPEDEADDVLEAVSAAEGSSAMVAETPTRNEEVLAEPEQKLSIEPVSVETPPATEPTVVMKEESAVTEDGAALERALAQSQSSVASLRKCETCGFPVSEGRRFCLDCERRNTRESQAAAKSAAGSARATPSSVPKLATQPQPTAASTAVVPRFLEEEPAQSSWLASHKYMVGAVVVALVGIVILLVAH
jgi:putative methionine-R-sulfoxide reductase with GAF domain